MRAPSEIAESELRTQLGFLDGKEGLGVLEKGEARGLQTIYVKAVDFLNKNLHYSNSEEFPTRLCQFALDTNRKRPSSHNSSKKF